MDDFEFFKHKLNPAAVLAHYGYAPAEESPGRLHYHSPFRPDNNPSLDIWFDDEKGYRAGDWAEGWQGDSLDLICRLEDCAVADAVGKAYEILRENPEVPALEATVKELAAGAIEDLYGGLQHGPTAFGRLVDEEGWYTTKPVIASNYATIAGKWGLSALSSGAIGIPYFDIDGDLVGFKTRKGSEKRNAAGSKLCLYGLSKLRDGYPIFLVEGESDAWAADIVLGDTFDVLGIPGAGRLPDKLWPEVLNDRYVVVALDPDAAGQKGAKTWHDYLVRAGVSVSVAVVPGEDIAALPADVVRTIPERIRVAFAGPTGFIASPSGYQRVAQNGNTKNITNWTLNLTKVLRGGEGETAYEATVHPSGSYAVISTEDLTSTQRVISWCTRNGLTWTGSGQDHQQLAQLLQAESLWLPEGRMTRRVGYHEGDYVWAGGHLGVADWTYVPPLADVGLEDCFTFGTIDPLVKHSQVVYDNLTQCYAPEVVTPLIAWLCASFLRPVINPFPILFVSGTSGSGKTTLIEHMLPRLTGSLIETNLTNSTPHAIASFFGCSTSFPVWFDEYRPGMKDDTKKLFDQFLRDSYNGKRSTKGGQTANLSALTSFRTDVPVIVSGEDSMVEESVVDRSIILRLSAQKKGVLAAFPSLAMLLMQDLQADRPPAVIPEGPSILHDRQRWNLGVLRAGWRVFSSLWGPEIDEIDLDLSLVIDQWQTSVVTPIEDAVMWALDEGLSCVWHTQEGELCVQAEVLLKEVRKANIFTLPVSNAKGIKDFLKDKFDGQEVRAEHPLSGHRVRVVRFAYDRMELV